MTCVKMNEWRELVHSFSDSQRRIYTVTNVPNDIRIPHTPIAPLDQTSSLFHMRRPQLATDRLLETPFLLRANHPNDPLLSRLALGDAQLRPIRFAENEYGLSWEVRQSWRRLEDGLSFVATELLYAAGGDREYHALSPHEFWPDPSEKGYLDLYRSEFKARRAILQAREAFLFLAARVSLAIALWRKNTSTTYQWVSRLERLDKVPNSWLDALQQSVISQFAHGLRVGTFVDPVKWQRFDLLPLFKRALLPLFFCWPNPSQTQQLCDTHAQLRQFVPVASDGFGAYHNPPHANSPGIFLIFHNGITRTMPITSPGTEVKPCGPFQRPGESSKQFIERMNALAEGRLQTETSMQKVRRLRRQASASPDEVPPPWVKVYVWVKAGSLDADIRPDWVAQDVRVLLHPSAVAGLWTWYGRADKYYNFVYDAWDLGGNMPFEMWPNSEPSAWSFHPLLSSDLHTALQDDVDFIYRVPDMREVDVRPSELALQDYFGVHRIASTVPGVDYVRFFRHVEKCFGLMKDFLDGDEDGRQTYAGFVWSVLNDHLLSDATRDCWDLDPRCEHYVLNIDGLDQRVARVTPAPITSAARHRLFIIQFCDDILPTWMLAAEAMVILFLLRKTSITTAAQAVEALLRVGLPFHTLRLTASNEVRMSFDLGLCSYSLPSYRRSTLALTSRDYRTYELRVMELLHRPHVRAAVMAGGIIWRIAMNIMGYDDILAGDIQSSVLEGPSINSAAHAALVQAGDGLFYVDDVLNSEEEDIFAGVYKLFTDQQGQMETASWWPRQSQWMASGMDNGVWSPWNEHFFQTRLKDITNGQAKLKNIGEWKHAIALYAPARILHNKLRHAAETFLLPA